MSVKAFIDSNIFLYAFGESDLAKQVVAKRVVLADQRHHISTQVINEVSNNLLRKLGLGNDDVLAFVEDCYRRYSVVEVSQGVFVEAVSLRKNYQFSYYDSVIVAAALLSNCDVLYSEDMQHGQLFAGQLTIVNPFEVGD